MLRTALTLMPREIASRIALLLLFTFGLIALVPQCTRPQQVPATTSPAAAVEAPIEPRVEALPPRLLAQPRKLRSLEGQTSYPSAASFSPDGLRVIAGSDD